MIDAIPGLLKAVKLSSDKVEITESLYQYYREILPPRKSGDNYFIFSEDFGEHLLFKKKNDRYFCELLSCCLSTENMEVNVCIRRDHADEPFRIGFIFDDGEFGETPAELEQFIGLQFSSVTNIAAAMGVSFHV